jgi:2-polyprenyl-6-methoxyphenol hydroxylase-like FAD-dependent oxidoreductase
VLIAGAGPTGLVLALWLDRLGVGVRIIDKKTELEPTSRALVVHARTLEFYRQLGIADQVIEASLRFDAANLWVKGHLAGRVGFSEMGAGLSPFPFALIYPQDKHERLLIDKLAARGIQIERPCELVDFKDHGDHIVARLRRADGSLEECRADYLAGCDGARSTTREILQAGFPGSTYAHLFYVADIEGTGAAVNGELNVALDDADFVAIFPLSGEGHARLIGIVRPEEIPSPTGDHPYQRADQPSERISWEDVRTQAIDRLGLEVKRVNWFSTYHVHHRVAQFFRRGRAFLLGDAAHIHSPVGGQGMNTGIGDAVNLAWKLGDVLRGRSAPNILDSYEPERIAFARRLVATTDQAFEFITGRGSFARLMRVQVAPRVLPWLFTFKAIRRFMFRTVSQISIRYRDSPLSQGRAGRIHAGDRLPWVPFAASAGLDSSAMADNFVPLASLDWQAHVYGDVSPEVRAACSRAGLALHAFDWSAAAEKAELVRGAIYVVRPDGYIGLANHDGDPGKLAAYLSKIAWRDVCSPRPM